MLYQAGPCTTCKKKQSASKRSICTGCQKELVCRGCSQARIGCGVCRTNPGWHLEFKAKRVTGIPSLPDQDCQAKAPWCTQGAVKPDMWHSGSNDVSQSP